MKNDPNKNVILKLNRMREELELLARPESKASFLKSLDSLIATLSRLRAALTDPSLEAKTVEIQKPLEQVIGFLEFAKNDEFLRTILSPVKKLPSPKPKRQPIKIPSNLTNEQIRSLLEKDLTKDELAAIAAQREISIGELNREESKRSILKNLERQEGYQRLASS